MTPKNKPAISFSIDRLLDPEYSSKITLNDKSEKKEEEAEEEAEGGNASQVIETQIEHTSSDNEEDDDCFVDDNDHDETTHGNYLRGNETVLRPRSPPITSSLIHKNMMYKDSRTVTSSKYHHHPSHHHRHHPHTSGIHPAMSNAFNLTDRLAGKIHTNK